MLTRLGSDYGGHWVDLELIKDGDTILDCGVGYDLTFAEAILARRKVNIIGIDPSIAVHRYVQGQWMPAEYSFMRGAVSRQSKVKMYFSKNIQGSESTLSDHRSVIGGNSSYEAEGVRLDKLLNPRTSLVKLDIEGMEYEVYRDSFGVTQVCIEFHHGIVETFTEQETLRIVDEFRDYGYEIARVEDGREYLFIQQ